MKKIDLKNITLADLLFIILVGFSLVSAKLVNIPMQWLSLGILLIFIAVYMREKYIYLITVFTFLTIFFVISGNIVAYNFYFKILIIAIILGLLITGIENIYTILKKTN